VAVTVGDAVAVGGNGVSVGATSVLVAEGDGEMEAENKPGEELPEQAGKTANMIMKRKI
jgi:hypothetical protein